MGSSDRPEPVPADGVRGVLAVCLLAGLLFGVQIGATVAIALVLAYYHRRRVLPWRSWLRPGAGAAWRLAGLFLVLTLVADVLVVWSLHSWPALGEFLARLRPPETHWPIGPWPLLVPALLQWAVLPAIGEEFLFRGLVLQAMLPRGRAQAVWSSSLLFAFLHVPALPSHLLAGVALALLTLRYGSLWPAVALHFAANSCVVVLSFVMGRTDLCPVCSHPWATLVTALAVGAAAVVLGRAVLGDLWRWVREEIPLSWRQAGREVGFLLRHGSVWVLVALTVLEMVFRLSRWPLSTD